MNIQKSFYSIADQVEATGGHASGFDYLRLILAVSIVFMHSGLTSYGFASDVALYEGPARPIIRMILPAFFALSGFLVAGSLERSRTLGMFLGLRILRIYPGLIVEVLLCALVLGPLVTTLPLAHYFSDPQFFQFFLNAAPLIHPGLPGVFERNPFPGIVNGHLWTIPFELYGYLTLAAIALLGLRKHRILAPAFVVIVTVSYAFVTLFRHNGEVVHVAGAINGALLIATFLAGVSMYLYRDFIPWTPWAAAAAAGLSAVFFVVPYGDFFVSAPAAYFTVYVGLLNPSRKILFGSADYSYGIYLYGSVIQQTLVSFWPFARFWLTNIAMALPVTFLVAAASWYCVEKPAQQARGVLKQLEAAFLSWNVKRRAARIRAD